MQRSPGGNTAAVVRERFTVPLADGRTLSLGGSTLVMGILNVTPDSFSDGDLFTDPGAAFEHAGLMIEDGAGIIDVGGESTRPGAAPVGEEEEIRRIVPTIERIFRELRTVISVDTTKAAVARAALDAGADIVNDISALGDPEMAQVVARSAAPVVLMHMRGTPGSMQSDTGYDDLMTTLVDFLRSAVEKAIEGEIAGDKIIVDPGIGFGKSTRGNLEILRRLPTLCKIGRPVLVGPSRKSFIGAALGLPVTERLEGSLAAAVVAAWQGAHILRVHDVAETVRMVRMVDAVLAN